jgi:hypothetical protein
VNEHQRRTVWTIVAGILVALGLGVVAFFAFLAYALSTWGSNK